VARKERNLYGPGVVHDSGIPHGSSDDPVVRALVLPRPQVKHHFLPFLFQFNANYNNFLGNLNELKRIM
jgi:hypothetical protein